MNEFEIAIKMEVYKLYKTGKKNTTGDLWFLFFNGLQIKNLLSESFIREYREYIPIDLFQHDYICKNYSKDFIRELKLMKKD